MPLSVLKSDLIIVDGIKGDLSFELGRNSVAIDRIFLGTNPVEIDSIIADTMGYQPEEIGHLACTAAIGLGTMALKKIEIRALNNPTRIILSNAI